MNKAKAVNFKVGDRFEVTTWLGMESGYVGNKGTIVKKHDDSYSVTMDGDEYEIWTCDDSYMKHIEVENEPIKAEVKPIEPIRVDVIAEPIKPTKQKKDKPKNIVHFMKIDEHREYVTVYDGMGNIVQGKYLDFVPEENLTIIINGTTTIIISDDGTKAVAKLCEGDTYSQEKGFQIAYSKLMIKRWEKMLKRLSK